MGEPTATLPDLRGDTLTEMDSAAVAAALGRVLPDLPPVPVASFGSAI